MNAVTTAASPFGTMEPIAICPRELLSHRMSLVRFAARRLRDPMLAEDLVHDVFEAVLAGRAAFSGRSSLRSWLTGILKHKIIDLVRRNAGTDSFDEGFDAEGATPLSAATPGPRRSCRTSRTAGADDGAHRGAARDAARRDADARLRGAPDLGSLPPTRDQRSQPLRPPASRATPIADLTRCSPALSAGSTPRAPGTAWSSHRPSPRPRALQGSAPSGAS